METPKAETRLPMPRNFKLKFDSLRQYLNAITLQLANHSLMCFLSRSSIEKHSLPGDLIGDGPDDVF